MPTTYQKYPISTVILANTVTFFTYALGVAIFLQLRFELAVAFFAYCIWMEIRLLRGSCVNCYYYGSRCAFGKGKICALIFPKRNRANLTAHKFTWKNLIPDFLVLVLPLLAGIVSLIQHFSVVMLLAMVVITLLATWGNAMVRGSLACAHCAQRELGCQAAQFFGVAAK